MGMVRREWEWVHVLGRTASSVIIRAPRETFADMEDMGTILWGGTDPQQLPYSLTCSLSTPTNPRQFLDWRAGWGLVGKGL